MNEDKPSLLPIPISSLAQRSNRSTQGTLISSTQTLVYNIWVCKVDILDHQYIKRDDQARRIPTPQFAISEIGAWQLTIEIPYPVGLSTFHISQFGFSKQKKDAFVYLCPECYFTTSESVERYLQGLDGNQISLKRSKEQGVRIRSYPCATTTQEREMSNGWPEAKHLLGGENQTTGELRLSLSVARAHKRSGEQLKRFKLTTRDAVLRILYSYYSVRSSSFTLNQRSRSPPKCKFNGRTK